MRSQSTDNYLSENIRFWADVADFMGFSRSLGEVYGIFFVSESPLSADDVAAQAGASRSGCGQHIKSLTEIGALRVAQNVQERKTHFELQTDLGVLIRRLMGSRVIPRLAELNQQRLELHGQATANKATHLIERFERLERWKDKTTPLAKLLHSYI